jgi:predicted nucleic acid-binding protein
VKLALDEPEQAMLRRALDGWSDLVSSSLLRVECLRACARYGADRVARAEAGLRGVSLVPMDDPLLMSAAALEPPGLRSLDAIHLATALSLGNDLGAMYVYDDRLAATARAAGITVEAPG